MTQDKGPPPGTRPRHEAGDCRALVFNTQTDEAIGPLMDASRAGMRVAVDQEYEIGSEYEIRIEFEDQTIVAARKATIRWTKPGDETAYFAGFLFDAVLSWEEIGELFLTGALQTNHPKFADIAD